ncbi:Lrp/AsnC family transcriptional regulator [Halovenus rubra]|uniref:Lrp/AsnC family transcriptional regulator n=2 Tax=Halovenus rubra TaxID=869890 RepID=A0ABD5X978_9EURY|nr:Lrp/AsnC family transcriptional regulator [Halovenus rubra]
MSQEDVLAVLRKSARNSPEDIARQLDMDTDEVEAVIEQLEDEGVIKGYQAILDRRKLDEEVVRAAVQLNVTLDRETGYEDIASRLAKFEMVDSLHLVSGDFDFLMEVEAGSMREVSQFISDKVAPVPEITQTITHYVMDSYKEQGILLGDGHDDDRLSISP